MHAFPDVERFLRARFQAALPGPGAQRRFAPVPRLPDWEPDLVPDHARHAAALVLLFPGREGPTIPLTLRHLALPRHAGQISLPGGAINPGECPAAAAAREAEEEIGVPAGDVRVLGALSTLWIALSNFVVHPFVAVTDDTPGFRLHPGEVESLVEAPLATVLDAGALAWGRRDRLGVEVGVPHFRIDRHTVWGATAMMLGEFACLFDPDFAPPSEG